MPRGQSMEIDAAEADAGADDELVEAARHDRRAFAPLYRHYVTPIYRFCYRRLGNREDAEDATSQVFTKALAALDSYRAGSFRAWLFVIAGNVVKDRHRSRRLTGPFDVAFAVLDAGPTPEDSALAADDLRTLRALLNELSDDQRFVVELRLSGLTAQEVAEAMQRKRGAVDALQYRAVTRLRRLMEQRLADEEDAHAAR
ncbi:MAG: RNA polymerase sigma factor [Thermomicrobiales bacterium]